MEKLELGWNNHNFVFHSNKNDRQIKEVGDFYKKFDLVLQTDMDVLRVLGLFYVPLLTIIEPTAPQHRFCVVGTLSRTCWWGGELPVRPGRMIWWKEMPGRRLGHSRSLHQCDSREIGSN